MTFRAAGGSMFELRTVQGEEAEIAHNIILECGQDMASMGYTHWTDPYPLDRFCDDAERGSVYGLFVRRSAIATISVFPEPPDYLDASLWSANHTPAMYVARLAVRPAYQGKSYGRFLMHFAEVAAHTWKRSWIRLAAVATYPPIRSFYEKLGYQEASSYPLFKFEIVAYEKRLSASNHL